MRKVDELPNGKILVEMTKSEWEDLFPSDLVFWKDTFKNHIRLLDLPSITRNCLLRGIGWESDIVPSYRAFSKNGKLLSFAEWCEWIQTLEGKSDLRSLRNFGSKSYEYLIKAILS